MRFTDPAIVNAIANIPEVSRSISADGEAFEFDFSQAIANPANIFLLDGGVGIFEWSAPRVYQWHVIFPPSCRGRAAIEAVKRMRDYMMANHANMIWAQPKVSSKAVIWLALHIGMKPCGTGVNSAVGPVAYYSYGAAPCHH